MKPRISLLDDWRCVLRRAWSIRFSLLAAAFTAAEVVVPFSLCRTIVCPCLSLALDLQIFLMP